MDHSVSLRSPQWLLLDLCRPAERLREYECDILIAVKSGRMSQHEASDVLRRTNAMVANVREQVPGDGDLWTDTERFCEDSPEWRRQHAGLLLDLFEVRALLRKVDHKNG
jgi:hypothetical protein